MKKNNKSHLTAIGRTKFSRPFRYLSENGFVDVNKSRTLDFGCGRGFDATNAKMEMYDPYYFPQMPKGKFDVILCNFVLNVLLEGESERVIKTISSKLKRNGKAYFTVRRNLKESGYTSTGTYQRMVYLDFPVIYEDNDHCIYEMSYGAK